MGGIRRINKFEGKEVGEGRSYTDSQYLKCVKKKDWEDTKFFKRMWRKYTDKIWFSLVPFCFCLKNYFNWFGFQFLNINGVTSLIQWNYFVTRNLITYKKKKKKNCKYWFLSTFYPLSFTFSKIKGGEITPTTKK